MLAISAPNGLSGAISSSCFVAVPQAEAARSAANKCVSDRSGLAVVSLSHGFNNPYATDQHSQKLAAQLIPNCRADSGICRMNLRVANADRQRNLSTGGWVFL